MMFSWFKKFFKKKGKVLTYELVLEESTGFRAMHTLRVFVDNEEVRSEKFTRKPAQRIITAILDTVREKYAIE